MLVIRILNVVFYIAVLIFLKKEFLGDDFFSQMGGAEKAFILLYAIMFAWIVTIAYGLALSRIWSFKHALWLNAILICVLSFKIVMSILGSDVLSVSIFFKENSQNFIMLVFLILACSAFYGGAQKVQRK